MTMKRQTVLIVEDRPTLRLALYQGLNNVYGFNVIAAKDAEAAWSIAAQTGDIDVVLLDVELPGENGLEFGQRLKKLREDAPPEFLVYTAHDKPEYYQMAMALGAAGYLQKGKYGGAPDSDKPPRIDVLSQHIRALALRRSLQRSGITDHVRAIAEKSRSREEAITNFCKEILIPELRNTFGQAFVVLLSNGGRTTLLAGSEVTAPSGDALQRIQAAVYARVGDADPLVVNTFDLLVGLSEGERESARFLDCAAFIPLAPRSSQLSLGLLSAGRDAEPAKQQAKVLDNYFQREIVGHLMHMTWLWSEIEANRRIEAQKREAEVQKREVLLTATSKFCLYQGQEILSVLFDAQQGSDNMEGLVPVTRLQTIGTEMLNAGQILTHFAHSDEPLMARDHDGVPMKQLIEKVWSTEVSPRLRRPSAAGMLRVDGECRAFDREERAGRAVSQILGWMGRRLLRFGESEDDLALFVVCNPPRGRERVQVIFEERTSRRLPVELRRTFFEPFYAQTAAEPVSDQGDGGRRLGLYLAQTLAQLAGGALSDRSDDIGGPRGHRFVLELPAAAAVNA
jgi:DNA-binding NarL/FixJ family response regulator